MKFWFSTHKREVAALATVVALLGAGSYAMATTPDTAKGVVAIADRDLLVTIHSLLHDAGIPDSTSTTAPTTTQAPTTTGGPTTTVATTTTQAPTTTAPPTTTTIPATTTTSVSAWPAQTGPSYDFFVNIAGLGNSIRIWNAVYFRGLTSGAGWADGNRDGYKCAYGILLMPGGAPGGRVTFTRIPGAAYATIVDESMPENGPTNRHYVTGLLTPTPVKQGECPPPNEIYSPNTQPGQRPVIDYLAANGTLLERRDYRTLQSSFLDSGRLKFHLTDVTAQRVTVVAFWDDNPIVAIYYDAPIEMASGVTMVGYVP